MNVNDCFSHELGGDTLSEYIYNKVKQKTKEDFFPAKNSEDLIGEVTKENDSSEEEEPSGSRIICKCTIDNYTAGNTVTLINDNRESDGILPSSIVTRISIDGNILDEVVTSYVFEETGEHNVIFYIPESITKLPDYMFYNDIMNSDFPYNEFTSIELPDTITEIGIYSLASELLETIKLGNSVISIGSHAFEGCSNLSEITIPDGVTALNDYVFFGCSALTSITIPNSVTSIGNGAFNNTGLTSITIPSSVTNIGNIVFDNGKLTSITSLATTAPTITSETFNYIKSGGTLYVPAGSTGYNVWMGTGDYYLGKYNWTKVEQ